MAKNTSTSKAKTKTSKKPAAAVRATAKNSTNKIVKEVKSTKPVESSKPTASKVTITKARRGLRVKVPRVSLGRASAVTGVQLRKFNLLSAVTLAVLAAVAGAFMKLDSYTVSVGHVTKDALRSAQNTVFAPAQSAVFDVRIVWLVAGILALASVIAVLRATKLRAYERRSLDAKVMPWRWLDLGLTGALMLELVALLSGMQVMQSLKMLGILVGVAAVLAWFAERAHAARVSSKAQFVAAAVVGVVPFLIVAGYLFWTEVFGMVRLPWYVYAAYAVLLVGYGLIARNTMRLLKGKIDNYLTAERSYARLGLLTKVAFAVVLIVGLLDR
jgi:uncharacterized membrane protein YuzA (DUF378 family)